MFRSCSLLLVPQCMGDQFVSDDRTSARDEIDGALAKSLASRIRCCRRCGVQNRRVFSGVDQWVSTREAYPCVLAYLFVFRLSGEVD